MSFVKHGSDEAANEGCKKSRVMLTSNGSFLIELSDLEKSGACWLRNFRDSV